MILAVSYAWFGILKDRIKKRSSIATEREKDSKITIFMKNDGDLTELAYSPLFVMANEDFTGAFCSSE